MAAAAPLIADPIVRNRGTLVGSLCHADPQGDWASVVTALGGSRRRAGPGRPAHHPDRRLRHRAVRERARARRDRGRGGDPAGQGTRAGGYLKLERRVGDFATVGVAVAIETSGETVTRAGIALTGVGGSTIAATAAADALTGPAADRRDHRAGRRPRRARRPGRGPTIAAAPNTSGTWCTRSSRRILQPRGDAGDGKGGLNHDDRLRRPRRRGRRTRSRYAGSSSRSTARRRSPRSSPGCCCRT